MDLSFPGSKHVYLERSGENLAINFRFDVREDGQDNFTFGDFKKMYPDWLSDEIGDEKPICFVSFDGIPSYNANHPDLIYFFDHSVTGDQAQQTPVVRYGSTRTPQIMLLNGFRVELTQEQKYRVDFTVLDTATYLVIYRQDESGSRLSVERAYFDTDKTFDEIVAEDDDFSAFFEEMQYFMPENMKHPDFIIKTDILTLEDKYYLGFDV